MLKGILFFTKEEAKKLEKLLNNEEIEIKDNLDFFKLLSEKASQLNNIKIDNVNEEENKKIYIINYYRDLYQDYISSLKRNNTN